MFLNLSTCICIYTWILYKYMHKHNTYIQIYLHVYIYIYLSIYNIYIYMYTYTSTLFTPLPVRGTTTQMAVQCHVGTLLRGFPCLAALADRAPPVNFPLKKSSKSAGILLVSLHLLKPRRCVMSILLVPVWGCPFLVLV